MGFTTTVTAATIALAVGNAASSSQPSTQAQWEMWIDDALMLINDRAAAVNVTVIDQAKIDYVVREAVAAHVKRPDNATQVTVSVDDGQTSKSYRSGKGRVTITDDDWALLGLTARSGAYSIDMGSSAAVHLAWCSLMMGAGYCSCGVDIAGQPIFELGD